MKEFELYKEPVVEQPIVPDAAKEHEVRLQAELRESELAAARAGAKAEAMERFVREGFAQGRSAPPQDAVRAQEDLGLSDEDILSDPTGAISKLQAQIRQRDEAMREYQERANSVIGNLAKNSFRSEMQSLSKERYSEWITPYVEDYFRKNPQEAFTDGAVRRVYHELVGQNLSELERLQSERTSVPLPRQRVVEESARFSSASEPSGEAKKQLLSDEDEFMRVSTNSSFGGKYAMSPEEWADIRSGKKYPKKIATDIQVRGAKPNVSYD